MTMKYAFMTFSCPDWDLDAALGAARRYGYDGIELRVGSGHQHGIELDSAPEQRAAARQKAADAGVAICCVACGAKFADPAMAEKNSAEAAAAIDLAADLGAGVVRVFGGAFPESVTRAQAADSIVRALSGLAPQAAQRGVRVCIETHDSWCDPRDVAAVLGRVGHPSIGANWDYQHTTRVAKATPDEAFALLKPFIGHVHFHDGTLSADKLEFLPIGQGAYDHRRVLQLLHSIDYGGYLSGEWIAWDPPEVHLPRELAAMKALEATL